MNADNLPIPRGSRSFECENVFCPPGTDRRCRAVSFRCHLRYRREQLAVDYAAPSLHTALGVTLAMVTSDPCEHRKAALYLLIIYGGVRLLSWGLKKPLRKKGRYPPKTGKSEREYLNEYWKKYRHRPKRHTDHYRGVRMKWAFLLEPTSWGVAAAMAQALQDPASTVPMIGARSWWTPMDDPLLTPMCTRLGTLLIPSRSRATPCV